MPLRLTVLPEGRPPWHQVLWERVGSYSVGRGADNEVLIDDQRISRVHGRFSFSEDLWWLEDLDSANGIAVDGLIVPKAKLDRSCEVRFGNLITRVGLLTRRELERDNRERLQSLQATLRGVRFESDQESSQLLDRLLTTCARVCGASRGFILIGDPNGTLELRASMNIEREVFDSQHFSGSLGAVRRAMETKEPVVVADATADAGFADRMSVATWGIRCLICLPLSGLAEEQGVIYLDSREPGKIFDELDVEFLESLASHASLALEVQRLRQQLQGVRHRVEEAADSAYVLATGAEQSECSTTTELTIRLPLSPAAKSV